MKIAIVGLSHQGYIWSIFLSKYFKKVGLFDIQKERLNRFKNKNFPNYIKNEENFNKYKKHLLKNSIPKNYHDLKFYDTILVTEDVIIKKNFTKDTKNIKNNIDKIVKNLSVNSNIVLMSQVNPGSTRKFFSKIKPSMKISIFYIPDVLIIGTAIKTLENYKHFLIGGIYSIPSLKEELFLKKFFTKIEKKFSYAKIEEVELVKEAIQLKLSFDVTFVNLLSSICEQNNLSLINIINFLKNDKRFSKNSYWRPGLGFGGGHIERGLKYFHDNLPNYDSKFMSSLINYNELRMNWLYEILDKNKHIKNIFIWGATYKKNTSSIFRSYTSRLITKYKNKYRYTIYDPGAGVKADLFKKKYVLSTNKQFMDLKNIDCLIILSDWEIFNLKKSEINKFKNYKKLILIDSYRLLLPIKKYINRMGIKYLALGND